MSNSVDSAETSQLELCCLQNPIAYGSERVKVVVHVIIIDQM